MTPNHQKIARPRSAPRLRVVPTFPADPPFDVDLRTDTAFDDCAILVASRARTQRIRLTICGSHGEEVADLHIHPDEAELVIRCLERAIEVATGE